MPHEILKVTEQTTNQLMDTVNRHQIDGWRPACGLLFFNARYSQIMERDTDDLTPTTCAYFIVDAKDGDDFQQAANAAIALNPDARCLSDVQYISARYLQAYGHPMDHSGGDLPRWYTEDTGQTHPIIDVDPNFSQIGLGNPFGGYVQMKFLTGGNNAGYITADDGTMTFYKAESTQLQLMDADVNLLANNVSVFNSNGTYTNLIATGSHVLLGNGTATVNGGGSSMYLSEGSDLSYINASSAQGLTLSVNGDSTSLQSSINLTNTSIVSKKGTTLNTLDANGFTKDTAGEYHYNIDGGSVFFSSGDITKIAAQGMYLQLDDGDQTILAPATYSPTVSNSVATKGYVDNTRPVNAVFRASFTTTNLALTQYVTADNTPQVVNFNAQAIPNAALGTLDNATGVFTAARHIVGTLAISCQVRRTTGGSAAVTWGFQVETSPDGTTWTPTPGSARYINLRGAGDNNILQTVNLTTAVDIPSGTLIRVTQMTDTASSNVGLVSLPAMLGGTTAAGLVFSLMTTL